MSCCYAGDTQRPTRQAEKKRNQTENLRFCDDVRRPGGEGRGQDSGKGRETDTGNIGDMTGQCGAM